jgi:hypothetical protein
LAVQEQNERIKNLEADTDLKSQTLSHAIFAVAFFSAAIGFWVLLSKLA